MRRVLSMGVLGVLLAAASGPVALAQEAVGAVRWRSPPAPGWTCAPNPSDIPRMPPVQVDAETRSYCLGPDGEVATVSVTDASDASSAFTAEMMLGSVAGGADPSWTLWREPGSSKTINDSSYLGDERGRSVGSMTVAVVAGRGNSVVRGNVPTAVLKAQVPLQYKMKAPPQAHGQSIVVIDVIAKLKSPVTRKSADLTRVEGLVRGWAGTIQVDPAVATRILPSEYVSTRPAETAAAGEKVTVEPLTGPGQCGFFWEVQPAVGAPVHLDIIIDGVVAVPGHKANRTGRYQWPAGDSSSPCIRPGSHTVALEVRSAPGGAVIARTKEPVSLGGGPAAPRIAKAQAVMLRKTQLVFLKLDTASMGALPVATWEYSTKGPGGPWEKAPAPFAAKAIDTFFIDLWDDEPMEEGRSIWVRASVRGPDGNVSSQVSEELKAQRLGR